MMRLARTIAAGGNDHETLSVGVAFSVCRLDVFGVPDDSHP